jgi:hypothetical protein
MRGRGQGSVVAAAAQWSRGGVHTAGTAMELGHSWLPEEAGNNLLFRFLFSEGVITYL